MRRLLILDVGGVICRKSKNSRSGENIINLPTYQIELRPGWKNFLEYCYANYDVGYLSSTPTNNLKNILNAILTEEQFKKTAFIWGRDRTRFDPEGQSDIETIKNIHDVISNPYVNKNKKYNMNNAIIVDDSLRKVRFNPENNYIIIPEYKGGTEDRELLKIRTLIETKFNLIDLKN